MADLAARRGAVEKLFLAVGCCWATHVIAREHCVAAVATAAATSRGKTMFAFARHEGDAYFSRRSITLFLIIALHIGIVWAFATGLGHGALAKVVDHFIVVPVDGTTRPKDPPPLPTRAHSFRPPRIELVDRVIQIDDTVGAGGALTVTSGAKEDPMGDAALLPPPVKRVGGGPGRGFPNTDDYYPADAIRKGQEGAAIIQTCVDERGKLVANPTVVQSSGTPSLDEGALKLAKAGSGHYRPATEDGRPVSSCFDFRITFRVKGGL